MDATTLIIAAGAVLLFLMALKTVLLVEKLFTYALGQGPSFRDRQTIERLSHQLKNNGYKLGDLIVGIVKSEPFQSK